MRSKYPSPERLRNTIKNEGERIFRIMVSSTDIFATQQDTPSDVTGYGIA
jgi:hypothetical protein